MAGKKTAPPRKNPLSTSDNTKKIVTEAHRQAEEDIEKDPDLSSKPAKEDDLDEGELARLEGED